MNQKRANPETVGGVSLARWLSRPAAWSRSQQLAMAALLCVALSLASSSLSQFVADAFAYVAYALVAALLLRMGWHRLQNRNAAIESGDDRTVKGSDARENGRARIVFWGALVLTGVIFYWLYLAQIFIVQDPNPEAMDSPLTIAYAEEALAKGIQPREYFRDDTVWGHLKAQDQQCMGYLGKRFQFEWIMIAVPFSNLCYVPFVKAVGVSSKTIALFSTFFAVIAWAGSVVLAWRVGGRWCAVLAALLMMSSLSWLIHVRVGYFTVIPSVALMALLGLCLHGYWQHRRVWALFPAGVVLGLMYMMGWIVVVFGVALTVVVIGLAVPRTPLEAAKHGMWILLTAMGTALLFAWLYASRYGYSAGEIHCGICDQLFGRFGQGEPVISNLSVGGKTALAFKCMFLDSQMPGHEDKYLEGCPAVPIVFSALLALGLLYSIKSPRPANKILLLWVLIVFSVCSTVFVFGHRYALLALPAMSILAARGVTELVNDLRNWQGRPVGLVGSALAGGALLVTAAMTHHDYYVGYIQQKPPHYEVDRLRGHYGFSEWLKKTASPQDTLVVMGDPIMFPRTCFLFNTYGSNYAFVYWSNYFRTGATVEQVQQWEKRQLAKYRRIVYAFSTMLIGDSQHGVFMNDWRPFVAAHPQTQPAWTYAYSGRSPSIVVFEVTRTP